MQSGMDVIVEGMGKTYIINAVRDGTKKITVDIDAAGMKKTVVLTNDSNRDKIAFNGEFDLGPYGTVNIVLDVNRDGKSGKMDVMMGSAVVFSTALKGKVDKTKKSAKYEVRYALGAKEGKVRLSLAGQPNMEFVFQYLPKGSPDLKIEITRSKVGSVIQWTGLASRGGEEYLNYKNKIDFKEISDAFTLDVESKFHVNDKSVLHPVFCSYGCFNDRSANMKVPVKKNTPYKFSVDIELFKDAQSVLTVDINTINNPYVFKLSAPRILPKYLPTGNPSIEFTADHKPGSYLKVSSNTRSLKSFSVIKVAGSNERKIELNGKELVRAGFSKGDNEISNTVTLQGGHEPVAKTAWVSSILSGTAMLSGPLASTLTNRLGFRVVIILGGLLGFSGIAGSYFARSLDVLFVSLGLTAGLGFSFTTVPSSMAINFYFEKKRSLATGITMCASGVGMLVYAPFNVWLIETYGVKGTLLILGAVYLNCVVLGCLIRPVSFDQLEKDEIETVKILDKTKADGSLLEANWVPTTANSQTKNKSRSRSLFQLQLFKYPSFVLICLSSFVQSFGFYVPYMYLSAHAVHHGLSRELSASLVSLIGISMTAGRLVYGYLGDHPKVNILWLHDGAMTVSGLLTLSLPFYTTYGMLVAYSVLLGLAVCK